MRSNIAKSLFAFSALMAFAFLLLLFDVVVAAFSQSILTVPLRQLVCEYTAVSVLAKLSQIFVRNAPHVWKVITWASFAKTFVSGFLNSFAVVFTDLYHLWFQVKFAVSFSNLNGCFKQVGNFLCRFRVNTRKGEAEGKQKVNKIVYKRAKKISSPLERNSVTAQKLTRATKRQKGPKNMSGKTKICI